MKNSFGVFFDILFGVITFSLGLYFLKNIFFISLIFFVATIVNILLYREYYIQKHIIVNLSSEIIEKEEVQIKNSKSISLTNCASNLVFIIISIFSLTLPSQIDTESLIVFAIIPIAAIVFSLIMIFLEIKKMNSIAINISGKGVQMSKKSLMNWNDIENEKIISRTFSSKESRHDFKSIVNYLQFYYKSEKIEIQIDNLDVTESELRSYLTIYRERFAKENKQI
ncbi:hypothetical protein NZ698_02785 [Chryseobacterium sp. PBS4-4]|uniref:Uncharacterized protein n=1 Tax=Chryseobacterium edaphi TaxID=2976532 RepID=A0ABT2W1L0_9FLAO|nr:hypothetical protein [Chryseobacterium edaphi]MCU7616113.1 hypothetical protein [Chryseobacterium edaphi]